MNGKVKFFNTKKGFGFITADDGKDYFMHYTQVMDDARLNEGDDVTFDPVETDKGMQAQNVKLGSEESSDEGSEEPETQEEMPSEDDSEDSSEDEAESTDEEDSDEDADEEKKEE